MNTWWKNFGIPAPSFAVCLVLGFSKSNYYLSRKYRGKPGKGASEFTRHESSNLHNFRHFTAFGMRYRTPERDRQARTSPSGDLETGNRHRN